MKIKDRTGDRVGRWLVVGPYVRRRVQGKSRIYWVCKCDCGIVKEISSLSLSGAGTQSCGCLKRERITTHNMTHTPEYRTWWGMLQRCENPKNSRYTDYGGRGISVCERWKTFQNFFDDMGNRPSANHSIDRWPDNDRGYEPGNCRWATRSQQQLNKRQNNTENLPRGDAHWTRREPERARAVAAANSRKVDRKGAANANTKLTPEMAEQILAAHSASPRMTLVELGSKFGVGKETARKVIRRLAWCS